MSGLGEQERRTTALRVREGHRRCTPWPADSSSACIDAPARGHATDNDAGRPPDAGACVGGHAVPPDTAASGVVLIPKRSSFRRSHLYVEYEYQCCMGVGQIENELDKLGCGRTAGPLPSGRAPAASNVVRTYGLPPVPRAEAQPFGRKSNFSNSFRFVQLPYDTGILNTSFFQGRILNTSSAFV